MRKRKTGFMIVPWAAVCLAVIFSAYSPGRALGQDTGEALFKANCSPCHPDGGNILNSKKTLHKKDREAHNIRTAADIVRKMRNPGPVPTHPQEWAGMKMFDKNKISDEDALKIADYILKTFN
ncbi:MAG: c-type cytochrome [Nitrospiraceae bacterium]|nr:c-type cytochrome [Nitrospiraceae bacterium]